MLVKSFLVALLGASVVNAHMIMTQPVPYGKDTINNSPLEAAGGDFPCKLRGSSTYEVTTENQMSVGGTYPLRFEGSATHGGGSCQISLTEDRSPTKSTTWKVIKSIEGGCPANVTGNMGDNASAEDPYHFDFTIPDGIEAGKYTLAWTWFNRIGNREMYMNCAPVTISSSSSKRSVEAPVIEKRTANFPPMFVANVNGCTTKEGIDIRFPQPGEYIQYAGAAQNLAPEGEAACTGTATFAGEGDAASGSSSSSSGSGSSSSSSESSTASGSAPTEASSQAPAAVPTTSTAPAASGVPNSPESTGFSTAPASPSSSSTSSSSSSGTLSGSCSPEGEWNCIAGTSFQRCANGQWSVSQQLAAGTKCTAGQSSDLSISAAKMAREISAMRFRRRTIGGSAHA
ncbi:CAZyme family AA11 [Penicillium macrosclerotiorum]|uniref:CAZyme family AA11 n=1 Tax=Penicillium macrosclerotiorum TaxID=303699 RepID=UPI002547F617|nr:CAZyme family AA11 [Penicillium macrosclerotiorum]KAJ5689237.1 CAZyme family AA11 [Penicillium macrosclerotiorum]